MRQVEQMWLSLLDFPKPSACFCITMLPKFIMIGKHCWLEHWRYVEHNFHGYLQRDPLWDGSSYTFVADSRPIIFQILSNPFTKSPSYIGFVSIWKSSLDVISMVLIIIISIKLRPTWNLSQHSRICINMDVLARCYHLHAPLYHHLHKKFRPTWNLSQHGRKVLIVATILGSSYSHLFSS